MFPLNTILAWNINIIMYKKYDNNNIINASRAYFLQWGTWRALVGGEGRWRGTEKGQWGYLVGEGWLLPPLLF
jgi:hypothetical protein